MAANTMASLSFTMLMVAMLAIAFLAIYVPARRASAVDPMQSLRAE